MSTSDPRMADDEATGDPYGLRVKREVAGAEPKVPSNICPQEIEDRKGEMKQAMPLPLPKQVRSESGGGGQQEGRPRTDSSRSRTDSAAAAASAKMAGGYEVIQLPQTFLVKYLGEEDASGLWGIKYTRKPVDLLVNAAKNVKPDTPLPLVKLEVSIDGIKMAGKDSKSGILNSFPIDSISYGVQDLVYTRVFAMIVVAETSNVFQNHPFRCYGFVCDSRTNARRLTLALAKAFQEFSHNLKTSTNSGNQQDMSKLRPKRFAIDLRNADELQKDMGTEEDSEA